MATVEPNSVAPSLFVSTRSVEAEHRFALGPVSWDGYLAIAAALGSHSGVRLTFDDGQLELMNPSLTHENSKKRIAQMVEFAAEQDGIDYVSGGSTTFRRAELLKALEPDDCYWLANADRMRGKGEWQGGSDPPPDLVLEVEISPASINRMKMYAALGVPEVWRFDGETLRFEILREGAYREGTSVAFPYLAVAVLAEFADLDKHPSQLEMLRSFRAWLAEHRPG